MKRRKINMLYYEKRKNKSVSEKVKKIINANR